LNLTSFPSPSTGCSLTEPLFSRKVYDLLHTQPAAARWDFELLKTGRHFRFDRQTKVILGRREAENAALQSAHQRCDARSSAILRPDGFQGPTALIAGPGTSDALAFAAGLIRRFARQGQADPKLRVETREGTFPMIASRHPRAEQAQLLTLVPARRNDGKRG